MSVYHPCEKRDMYTLKATALIAALGLLIATTPVIAMTGLEFLQAGDDAKRQGSNYGTNCNKIHQPGLPPRS